MNKSPLPKAKKIIVYPLKFGKITLSPEEVSPTPSKSIDELEEAVREGVFKNLNERNQAA